MKGKEKETRQGGTYRENILNVHASRLYEYKAGFRYDGKISRYHEYVANAFAPSVW